MVYVTKTNYIKTAHPDVSKELWISNEVFSWPHEYASGSYLDDDHTKLKRSHTLWQHANLILHTNPGELSRIDAISTLKRSLNHRLKLIESLYQLKAFSSTHHNNGYLGLLERLGIVRSSMLKKFLDVRNDIEHHDTSPPDLHLCTEFLDLIWYLLKSTDEIVRVRRNQLLFNEKSKDHYRFTLDIDYMKSHSLSIAGWFSNEHIYETKFANCTKVSVTGYRSIDDHKKLQAIHHADKLLSLMLMQHSFRKDQDSFLVGSLDADIEMKCSIIKSMLTAI